eukprot:898668-Prorocentrum_minimum.AAC.2
MHSRCTRTVLTSTACVDPTRTTPPCGPPCRRQQLATFTGMEANDTSILKYATLPIQPGISERKLRRQG